MKGGRTVREKEGFGRKEDFGRQEGDKGQYHSLVLLITTLSPPSLPFALAQTLIHMRTKTCRNRKSGQLYDMRQLWFCAVPV